MSNPVNNNNSTYAPNTSLRPATSTTNTVSDPFAQSSDPFAQSNVQNSSGGATNRAAGRVVDNNTPSGINKSDPVAMPTGVCTVYICLILIRMYHVLNFRSSQNCFLDELTVLFILSLLCSGHLRLS